MNSNHCQFVWQRLKALENTTLDGSIENRLRSAFLESNESRRATAEFRMEYKQLEQMIRDESKAL